MVIEYTGEPLPIQAETTAVGRPEDLEGVNILVTDRDGRELNGSDEVAVGSILTLTLTPDAGYEIRGVEYGNEPVEMRDNGNGSWSGQISVVKDAGFNVTVVRTFRLPDATDSFLFVDPISGEPLTGRVDAGTEVGIKVNCPQDKEIESISVNNEPVAVISGNDFYNALITVTSDIEVKVHLRFSDIVFAIPVVDGVGITVRNMGSDVKVGDCDKVAVGTALKLILSPADGISITSVEYAGSPVNLTWTGSEYTGLITAAPGAKLVVSTAVRTFVAEVSSADNCTVTLVDPDTGQLLTNPLPYGSVAGICVEGYPDNMRVGAVSCTDSGGNALPTGPGNSRCHATVCITSDVRISVMLIKKRNVRVSVSMACGGSVTVRANGAALNNPDSVARGAELRIALTPDSGFDVDILNVNGAVVAHDDSNNAVYMVPEGVSEVVIAATFVPLHKVTWVSPPTESGSLTVTCSGKEITAGDMLRHGDRITVVIQPAGDDTAAALWVNGSEINPRPDMDRQQYVYDIAVDADIELIARFVVILNSYDLVVYPADGGSIIIWDNPDRKGNPIIDVSGTITQPSCRSIKEGTPLYCTLSAYSGYAPGSALLGSNKTPLEIDQNGNFLFIMPDENADLIPDFIRIVPEPQISVEINDSSMGRVCFSSGNDGTLSDYNGPFRTTMGEVVTFAIRANPGYRIVTAPALTFSLDTPSEKIGSFTVGDTDASLVIVFEPIPCHALIVGAPCTDLECPDGTADLHILYNNAEISGGTMIPEGADVEFKLTAGTEFEIISFSVAGEEAAITDGGTEASVIHTMSDSPEVEVAYTIRHRTTIMKLHPATTQDASVSGSVYATCRYFNGKENVSEIIGATGEDYIVPTATEFTLVVTPDEGYAVESVAVIAPDGTTTYCGDLLGKYSDKNNRVAIPAVYATPSARDLSETSSVLVLDVSFRKLDNITDTRTHYVRIRTAEGQDEWGTVEAVYPSAVNWSSPAVNDIFIDNREPGEAVEARADANIDEPGRYCFESWIVSGAAQECITQTLAPDNLSGAVRYVGDTDATLTAVFRRNHKVSVTAPVNGAIFVTTSDGTVITSAKPVFVRPGTSLTITITSAPGNHVGSLLINDVAINTYNSAGTFIRTLKVSGDTRLDALFYSPSGIDCADTDSENTPESDLWFTVRGQYLGAGRPSAPGIYLRRRGTRTSKVVIK